MTSASLPLEYVSKAVSKVAERLGQIKMTRGETSTGSCETALHCSTSSGFAMELSSSMQNIKNLKVLRVYGKSELGLHLHGMSH